MIHRRRVPSFWLTMVGLAIALVGCGGSDDNPDAASSTALPEQISINETYPTLVVPDGHV